MNTTYFKALSEAKAVEIFPGFTGRFVHTATMTLVFWDVKAGSTVPEHSHVHEQMANVLEGSFELTVDGSTQVLMPGIAAVIPSGIKHSGRAVTDCKLFDIFSPVREDYKKRSDEE
ncbi:MAG TPA: cupin domain-containing protein [Panacibacter sp.]|nr:cupin domain-containing protein [Panacibacter sp.]